MEHVPVKLDSTLDSESKEQTFPPEGTKHALHLFSACITGLILHEGNVDQVASMPPGYCLGALEML